MDNWGGFYNFVIGMNLNQNIKKNQLAKFEPLMSKDDYKELCVAFNTNNSGCDHIDKHVYVKMFGYKDVDDYLEQVSVDNWTSQISVPLFSLHGRDDPISAGDFYAPFHDIESKNSNILYSSTASGGHASHIVGSFVPKCWYPEPFVEFLNFMESKLASQ